MGQIYYSKKFAEKTFVGTTTKEAYMKAVKWYASKVIANDKLSGVQVEFVKGKNEPKVTAKVYATLPEGEVRDQHCACCREMHHTFFINEEANCSRCNMLGFQKRLEHKINIKVGYNNEIMDN